LSHPVAKKRDKGGATTNLSQPGAEMQKALEEGLCVLLKPNQLEFKR